MTNLRRVILLFWVVWLGGLVVIPLQLLGAWGGHPLALAFSALWVAGFLVTGWRCLPAARRDWTRA